ncbi:MAG: HAMP domain-containing protein [Clostridia bacterium]|nr:HAMP domain-containing protein [Clostridia bacterium]
MSLNTKLFLIFALLVSSIAGLILLFNSTLLEGFYLRKKEKNIINFYNGINELYTSNDDSIEALTAQFEKLETNRSIDLVIKNSDGSNIYVTSKDYSIDYSNNKKVFWMNRPSFENEKVENMLTDDNQYIVRRYHDNFLNSDFLLLVGKLENGNFIYLRSPLEFVKESINISNSFLLIVIVILLFCSGILSYFISRSFTHPIRELNEMTKRMSNLDFSEKYKVTTNDEIGMLGNSINSLSESLENKIQELKEANIELEKDIEETSKISEMRSQFISDVSHELKTPIALIQGYAEGLVDNVVTDEEDRKYYIDVILDEANKMSELTRGLLDLTNLEYGKNELHLEKFDITNLVSSITKKNELLLNEKNISLEFDNSKHFEVLGDMFRIEQVVTNYLNNAVKNIDGERKIKILVEERENNLVRVNVTNSGKNIDIEDLSRIWVRFYKVDNSRTRSAGGSGIGLSLVRAIMTQHGTGYGVNNIKDGVNFWFELKKSAA